MRSMALFNDGGSGMDFKAEGDAATGSRQTLQLGNATHVHKWAAPDDATALVDVRDLIRKLYEAQPVPEATQEVTTSGFDGNGAVRVA